MGSAFLSDGLGSHETVLFCTWQGDDNSWVCHEKHEECEIECPHQMSECGRFTQKEPDV